ncbi:hypothetical protein Q1695_003757 [Nippostrongylus brasiliensis]|nr:hypothetical protein Q1695_003757 [Nippostrongylus brasiliensis]
MLTRHTYPKLWKRWLPDVYVWIRLLLLFHGIVVSARFTRSCASGNQSQVTFIEVTRPICTFEIDFDGDECVRDPRVKFEVGKDDQSSDIDILGHHCEFVSSEIKCSCYGDMCNSELHSREILAKEFATTVDIHYRTFILCYLTGGDETFENAVKKKVGHRRVDRAAKFNNHPTENAEHSTSYTPSESTTETSEQSTTSEQDDVSATEGDFQGGEHSETMAGYDEHASSTTEMSTTEESATGTTGKRSKEKKHSTSDTPSESTTETSEQSTTSEQDDVSATEGDFQGGEHSETMEDYDEHASSTTEMSTTEESATGTTVPNAAIMDTSEKSSAQGNQEDSSMPSTVLIIAVALAALVIVGVIVILMVMTIKNCMKISEIKKKNKNLEKRVAAMEPEPEGQPPKALEDSLREYSKSLMDSELDVPP